MFIDLTLTITRDMLEDAKTNGKASLAGHLGTHFDVMDKEFPLAYTEREGIVLDVSHIAGRDIALTDVDIDAVKRDMFVAFYTGYSERESYGSAVYFKEHPQLSDALIEALLEKGVSIIGVDCAGVRRGAEHTPKDQYCADCGVFVVENLCNLKAVVENSGACTVSTYPMKMEGVTGLPCRVIARVGK